ncbi:MAG: hypothetical protein WBD55_06480 [Dehalococcoidia bacterium]
MAVAQVFQFRIVQGKNQEFGTQVAEAKKIQERHGGRVRVWQGTMAGPNTGLVSYVVEHDDLAAFATFNQKLAADAEWVAFAAKTLLSGNPTGNLISATLANEITP